MITFNFWKTFEVAEVDAEGNPVYQVDGEGIPILDDVTGEPIPVMAEKKISYSYKTDALFKTTRFFTVLDKYDLSDVTDHEADMAGYRKPTFDLVEYSLFDFINHAKGYEKVLNDETGEEEWVLKTADFDFNLDMYLKNEIVSLVPGEVEEEGIVVTVLGDLEAVVDVTDPDAPVITISGELEPEDNIFTGTAAADFVDVIDGEGKPTGEFTFVSLNLKAQLTALGVEEVEIVQTNPALNIAYVGLFPTGVKTKTYTVADMDDEFNVLLVPGIATLAITNTADGALVLTITIDAGGMVVNGAV